MSAPRKCDCGECARCKKREYMNKWYRRKTLDERREWVSKRDVELTRARDRERWHRDKEKRRKLIEKYVKRYPEKTKARAAVARAVRAGVLVKQPCAVCGFGGRVHAHHNDYSKPLEVRWLCQAHHTEVHVLTLPRKVDGEEVS